MAVRDMENNALAAQIVVFRVLGLNKEFAIECMEELMRRKNEGSDFDYEAYIKTELEKVPKPDEKSNDVLKSLLRMKFE